MYPIRRPTSDVMMPIGARSDAPEAFLAGAEELVGVQAVA